MREIKFRGKRIDNGEWVYGNLIYSKDAVKRYETIIIPQKGADGFTTDYASNGKNKESYGFDNWFCVIPETVGQFTGLKDKSGKEIYEGDVVRVMNSTLALVKYSDDHGVYYLDCEKKIGDVGLICQYDTIKRVGSIHENPELLEGRSND